MLLFTDIRPHSQHEVATSNSRKALRIVALERETQRSEDMKAFHEHPGKGGHEEVMQENGHHRTQELEEERERDTLKQGKQERLDGDSWRKKKGKERNTSSDKNMAAAVLEWMLLMLDLRPRRQESTRTVRRRASMERHREEYVTMASVSRSPSNCCSNRREKGEREL
ncbi:hypothetical protein EYF80_025083 [Liparis tanakae]|uniref:Uncharacterized protein n=1 Tax=Liparis tanakae TaxID=230148 RepID=A0A4Z2HG23_9TELE|nr:hypothetical protein EYF80_025083 [Liparis tanakae]